MRKLKLSVYILLSFSVIVSNFFAPRAFAAALDDLRDLVSDSRVSTVSNHTLTVDMASGDTWATGETLIIDFTDGDGFDTSGFANNEVEDFDITVNGTEESIVANGGCASNDAIEITTVNTTTDTFTFTTCGSYTAEAGSGHEIVIEIGTHASSGGSGNDQITNSTSTGSKVVNVSGTFNGSVAKDTLIAITDGVTLSATVDETLTFTVAGVTTGDCSVTGGTEIDTSGSATTVPFGTINSDAFYDACQSLTVGTNAAGGYSTTVKTTTLPTSGANTILEGSCDGGCSDTVAAAWATAGNNGYGYCLKDENGTDGAVTAGWSATNECGDGTQHFKTINRVNASEAGQSIMASAGATTSNDQTEIGYRITIDAGQAAGSYSTVIIYVTTPTF
jgi:hypothetical protein